MPLSSLNSIGQTVFKVESGNKNMDGQMDGQTNGQKNGQMNGRINTNFERNLAIMVIYVPVKFEFDWTNLFRVRVRKQKCGRRDGWTDKRTTNGQTYLHQFRKEPSHDGDLFPCQV